MGFLKAYFLGILTAAIAGVLLFFFVILPYYQKERQVAVRSIYSEMRTKLKDDENAKVKVWKDSLDIDHRTSSELDSLIEAISSRYKP